MKQGKEFLEQFLTENTALSKRLEEHSDVFSLWPQVLCSLGLDILAQNSTVLDFQRQVLTVAVAHPVFLQDLKLHQKKWQEALEQALQGQKFTKISKIRYNLQA